MKRTMVLLLGLLASLVLPAAAAQAAVPANGIYVDHAGVLYSTKINQGCAYSIKPNVWSEGETRELDVFGQYLNNPPSGCYVTVTVRLWHAKQGIRDIVANRAPGNGREVWIGQSMGPVGQPGWKFVFVHVSVTPVAGGGGHQSQLGIVYDANPCLKNNAVCNVVSGWRAKNGIVRSHY